MHVTLYEVSGESQFSDSVWWLYDFANLLCKSVKCHEGSFLRNKISFAEEAIGNIIKSWKSHIDFVSKKISKSVGIIAKVRFYLSSQTLMTLYYSHVYPFLTYCNVAWSSTYCSSLNCIYLLQKCLVRLKTKAHYLASTAPLFSQLDLVLDTFSSINWFCVATFMYSYHHNLLPSSFRDSFLSSNQVHQYETWLASWNRPHFCRTNIKQFSILYRGPNIWNSLPVSLISSPSIFVFFKKN